MVHYFLESVKNFGGPISKNAHTVLSVGADETPYDLKEQYPWMLDYSIDIQWVDRELFKQSTYHATGFDRFWVSSNADIVALIDADLIVGGDFDQIVRHAHTSQQMLGFMAHVSPFGFAEYSDTPSEVWWKRIYDEARLPTPSLDWQYTGWGLDWDLIYPHLQIASNDPNHKHGPPYFNYGIILGPRRYFEKMGETFVKDLEVVSRITQRPYISQIANCVGFQRHDIPCEALSINYNFPLNLPSDAIRELNLDPNGENSDKDIKIFHYIGERRHFESQETIDALLDRRDLDGAWRVFQEKLRMIYNSISTV